MYICEICDTHLLKRNKTKHEPSNKHKYFSNLILNRYFIKNVEVNKLTDVFYPYFIAHTRKFNSFTVHISFRDYEGDPLSHKTDVSITSLITFKVNIIQSSQ